MAMSVCCYQERFDDSIVKARAKLSSIVGEGNILAALEGFMPIEISHVRSAPAFIFRLNDEGGHCYHHGIVGADDFWEYPESTAAADTFEMATDDGALGGAQTGAGAGSGGGGFPSGPTTRGGDQPPSAGGNPVPPKP